MTALLRSFRPILLLAIAVLAPLAAVLLIESTTDERVEGIAISATPVLAAVTDREITDLQRVTLVLEWEKGRELHAPAWRGTVTAVYVVSGGKIASGQGVAAIDGVTRVAWAGETPFYRTLRAGDSGADVAELHRLLLALGHMDEEPDDPERYTAGTTAPAVRSLEEGLGVVQPSGVFDPAWVVWLPAAEFPVGELKLELAAPAPAPGQAFVSEPGRLKRARIESANPQEQLNLDPSVEYVLQAGTTPVPFDRALREVTKEGLVALAPLPKPNAERTDATVQRKQALRTVAVPSSAVMTNATGTTCVWEPDGDSYRAATVKVGPARAGVTNLFDGPKGGAQVLSNPASVLPNPQCP